MVKKILFLSTILLFIFFFNLNVNAATLQGSNVSTPNWITLGSNYNNSPLVLVSEDIFPNLDTWSYTYVLNKYVYVVACSDMPSLGYSFNTFYNSTTGTNITASDIRYTANLSSNTCTFPNGYKGKVVYLKFRLISGVLNVPQGSSDTTWLYNDKITLYIGTSSAYSFTIQSIYAIDDDLDIYSSGFDTSTLESQSQTIINQQNQNTNTIVNNQNQNTQDIINNQNQNTQEQIESQKVCNHYGSNYATIRGNLNSNGGVSNDGTQAVSDFINIQNAQITLLDKASKWSNLMCFYDKDKVKTQCYAQNDFNINDNIPIPENSIYFRYTIIRTEGKPQYKICFNGNQALNDSVNNLNDTLNDTSQPNTNQDVQDMDNMVASDTPISDLITMPLTLINAYINGIDASCSPVNLGNLLGTNLSIPCINIQDYIGSNLWNIIDILCCIFLCYEIAMLFISAFDGITSLRDDFEGLYQPRHSSNGYQPKHGGGN